MTHLKQGDKPKKVWNTVWLKYHNEPYGILQLHLKSGAIKSFVHQTKIKAKVLMRQWIRIWDIKE